MTNENIKRVKNTKLDPSYFYYNSDGKIVFTEQFHINRGYCCGNGCLHCPFTPKANAGNTTLDKKYL